MSWQEIITHEILWLGLGFLALAAVIGFMNLFINLFYGYEEDE